MISNSAKAQIRYRELLDDGNPHSRTELINYAKETEESSNFTEATLNGALKKLVDSENKYKRVGRGMYQAIKKEKNSCAEELMGKYVCILRNAIEKIQNEDANAFDVLDFNEEEKERMRVIKRCIYNMESTIKRVENIEKDE